MTVGTVKPNGVPQQSWGFTQLNHINQDDMKMKVFLETRPYDFKPDE